MLVYEWHWRTDKESICYSKTYNSKWDNEGGLLCSRVIQIKFVSITRYKTIFDSGKPIHKNNFELC